MVSKSSGLVSSAHRCSIRSPAPAARGCVDETPGFSTVGQYQQVQIVAVCQEVFLASGLGGFAGLGCQLHTGSKK